MLSLGPSLPLSPPPCLLPPAGDGPVHSRLALSGIAQSFLCSAKGPAVSSVSTFPRLILSLLLSHSLSCYLKLAPSNCPQGTRAGPYPKDASHSSVQPPLAGGGFIWGTFLLGIAFRHVICGFYLFFLPVRLPSEIWKLPPDLQVRGFPGVWKLPLLGLPSQDRSPSLTLLPLFLSFIFCPTSFWRQWAAFLGTWCPLLAIRSCFVLFAQRSSDLSMNLWERKWSPCPIPPPP